MILFKWLIYNRLTNNALPNVDLDFFGKPATGHSLNGALRCCSECSIERSRRGWSVGRVARACAARAALHARPASALLLDEPAAALDAPAERALLAAMAAVAPHTTVITVAVTIQ